MAVPSRKPRLKFDPTRVTSVTMPSQEEYKGEIVAFYHFYKPDDVVSAVHFSDLCEGLVDRGWHVTMMTSNRYCRYGGVIPERTETIDGVTVKRVWRPGFDQASNILRVINSLWLQSAWVWAMRKMPKPDIIVVGTDPQFSQFMLPWLRRVCPDTKIVYWSFDVYPEAIQADTNSKLVGGIANLIAGLVSRCYRSVHVMVDIGSCMRRLLRRHLHSAKEVTLVPWALSEPGFDIPVNAEVRSAMFGENVKLGVLYSGNMGKAHEYDNFLELARFLRSKAPEVVFAFSARGNRMEEFTQALTDDDTNIKILPFATQEELEDRLNAADIHLLSLKDNWAGIVVPSKFFGSLAAGKPVLYSGAATSCIGRWIEQYDLGLLIQQENIEEIASKLVSYSRDPQQLQNWKINAYQTYHERFSKKTILDQWDDLLEEELTPN